MRPAKIKLAGDIDHVYIHCEFCSNPYATQYLDTIKRVEASASLNFLHTLKENLQKSPLLEKAAFSMLNSDSLLVHLKDYQKRARENGLVIVLDSIYLKDTIITERIKYSAGYLYTYSVIHKFGCHTYNQRTMQTIDNYLMEDTVFWPSQYTEWQAASILTVEEAYWDTGIKAGEAYARYLAPYWVEQTRVYYSGNKEFRMAYKFMQMNSLDSALNILNKMDYNRLSKKMQMRNLHNTAIIYELKDDIEKALVTADSAQKVRKNEISKNYTDRLRLRKIDKIALDWQLN
jgi:hypothetical protein